MSCFGGSEAVAAPVETPKEQKKEGGEKKEKPPFKIKAKKEKPKGPPPKKFEGKPYGDLPPHHPAAVQVQKCNVPVNLIYG